jgi:uncharacterized protein YutE (UPF0331/DUF86 family)
MVFDEDSIHKHLELLRSYLLDLSGLRAEIPAPGALREDRKLQARTLFALQMAVQSCLDMAGHLVAELGLPRPEENAELFTTLSAAGHLDADLAAKMRAMTRFRNLIVHLYWTVDFDRVFDILQKDVADFTRFEKTVVTLLENPPQSEGNGRHD